MSEEATSYETGATIVRAPFDPSKHLRQLRGKGGAADYLDVRWRLVWLRSDHPEAVLETELVHLLGPKEAPNGAIFRARVAIPGGGVATGWGSQTAEEFGDWLEKCETRAIGRALAALGYGTQFVNDFDMEDERGVEIVDTPNQSARAPRPDAKPIRQDARREGEQGQGGGNQFSPLTERQLKFIHVLAREAGLDDAELHSWSTELYGMGASELNRRDASALIEALTRRKNELA